MAKAVANKKQTAVSIVNEEMLYEDSGAGAEGITSQDLMVPRISILQSPSPQVNKRDGKYVQGAEVGFIYNTVSNEVVDGEEGISVVPIKVVLVAKLIGVLILIPIMVNIIIFDIIYLIK